MAPEKIQQWIKENLKDKRFELFGTETLETDHGHRESEDGSWVEIKDLPAILEAYYQFREQSEWNSIIDGFPEKPCSIEMVFKADSNGKVSETPVRWRYLPTAPKEVK